jgi:hypothetical protein
MTWTFTSILGLITLLALFIPILFIVVFRISRYNSFPALLIYYVCIFSYTLLTQGYIKANENIITNWGLINNLLDAPLILTFLTYFSPSVKFTQRMKLIILSYRALEVIVVAILGFNIDAITIILGPGLLLVLSFCLYFFIRLVKTAISHHKAMGKALMVSSLLFGYGGYTMIYLLFYVFKTPFVDDILIIYFSATIIFSGLMCAGILKERKRIQKLNELKVTRRELHHVYKETGKAAPLRAALLDFDKEQWN